MSRFSSFILFFVLLVFCYPAFGEYIFLKDGSIISAKIISENDTHSKIQSDGVVRTVSRSEIIRVRYDSDFNNYTYIKRKDGSIAEGYIVEDMPDCYIVRENLRNSEEFKIEKKNIVSVSKEKFFSKGAYFAWGIIPGASQFYVKNDVKGVCFMGSNAAAWGFTGYSVYNYRKQKREYHNLERGLSSNKYNKKYNDYKKSYKLLTASIIISGSLYLAHWTDVMFFSKPDFSNNVAESGTAYLDFKFNESALTAASGSMAEVCDSHLRAELGIGMLF